MSELDEIDHRIIRILQCDGRKPYTEIAAALGVSEGTVRNRVKRLLEQKHMQIVAVVEPQFLGYNAAALIGITVRHDQIDAVAQQIGRLPEVTYLLMASGEYDLFAEVYCRDMPHLVYFLNRRLRQIPGVLRTETFMILKMYKLSYRWGETEPSPEALYP